MPGEEPPTESLDPRWPRLLAAARSWRAGLVPKTSTSNYGVTRSLVEAVEAFDEGWTCVHPRATRVYHADGRRSCGTCGIELDSEPPFNDTPEDQP